MPQIAPDVACHSSGGDDVHGSWSCNGQPSTAVANATEVPGGGGGVNATAASGGGGGGFRSVDVNPASLTATPYAQKQAARNTAHIAPPQASQLATGSSARLNPATAAAAAAAALRRFG
jgi:hypothetical protein